MFKFELTTFHTFNLMLFSFGKENVLGLQILWIQNSMHYTRMTVCSLPQMSRSLGPGRNHQELRSPGSTRTVTSRLSAVHPAQRPASHGTIFLSHVGPSHWTPGRLNIDVTSVVLQNSCTHAALWVWICYYGLSSSDTLYKYKGKQTL